MEHHTLNQRLKSADGPILIRELMAADPKASRGGLARQICTRLNWLDARGRPKEVGCRKVLLQLEREGRIVLPAARRERPTQRIAQASPPVCPHATGTLQDLGPVTLKPVKGGTEESATWRALMDAYHPLGGGPLCGEQIRYLIVSERHGELGGLAVSASAWRLKSRDAWLGWDDAERLKNLQGVVNNTRFLILPTVQVKNLASHVLGQLAQRVRKDWQERYNHSPWMLETFVDASRPGACYRAANWIEVGMTTGRGRQDSAHSREESKFRRLGGKTLLRQGFGGKKLVKTKTAEARKAKLRAAKRKAAKDAAQAGESGSKSSPQQALAPKQSQKTPAPNKAPGSKKRIFIYPLCLETLKTLCPRYGRRDLTTAGRDPTKFCGDRTRRRRDQEGWLHQEFGGARLGDLRLEDRLLQIGQDFFARPEANIPEACGGSRAKIAGTYRFLTHERTTMKAILEPHKRATIERMRDEPVVLVVEDSSSLNFTTHPATEDIGPIGTTADGPQGLILHSATVFRPDGLSLGVLHADCIRRDPAEHGKKKQRASKPIEEKESYKWIEALDPAQEAASQCPNTRLVITADREADIYEFFLEVEKRKLDLLIRAKEDRSVTHIEADRFVPTASKGKDNAPIERLWPQMERVAEAGRVQLEIPRRGNRMKRVADVSIRYAQVTFAPPEAKRSLPPFKAWIVWAKEVSKPPYGVEPLEWMLITTVQVHAFDDAVKRIEWYAARWNIEVFHRTIKSGCRTEDRQLGLADRIEACLAIDLVVAWRIQHLTWLSRAEPDAPCSIAYEDDEWRAVMAFTTRRPAPETPPTMREMTHTVAKMGGFVSTKAYPNPGAQTLWRGLQHMDDITLAFRAFISVYPSGAPPLAQRHHGNQALKRPG
jgi:hypothetical protein